MDSSNFCILCLENDNNIVNVHKKDSSGVTILEKLNFCVYSRDYNEYSSLMFICQGCISKLDVVYMFKKQWVKNIDVAFNQFTKHNIHQDVFETVKIKTEKPDNNEYIAQPQFEEVNVKVEPDIDLNVEEEPHEIDMENNFTEQNFIHTGPSVRKKIVRRTELNNFSSTNEDETQQPGKRNIDKSLNLESDDEASSEASEAASPTLCHLLPEKSEVQYERTYKQFKDWYQRKNVEKVTEKVILGYLEEKSGTVKASTLWSIYSMLKCTLNIKENIDIRKFNKIIPYLKKKSIGHRPQKSRVLTRQQIDQFMTQADNQKFLLMKVVLIMGISGACRRDELTNITIDDIVDSGSVLIVKLPDSKTKIQRSFLITNNEYIELYRQYAALRPTKVTSRRFFLKYDNGRCINQVVGINKIGTMPSLIAKYLQLPNAHNYTGHCFRRTSATLFVNTGAERVMVDGNPQYIEDSLENKFQNTNKNSNNVQQTPSTSTGVNNNNNSITNLVLPTT